MSKIALQIVNFERNKTEGQKLAVKAWFVSECDNCHGHGSIFYVLDDELKIDEYGNVEGGFYCQDCKFSNAGKCHKDWLVL